MNNLTALILKSALAHKTFQDSQEELMFLRLWFVFAISLPLAFVIGNGEMGLGWFLVGDVLLIVFAALAGKWGKQLLRALVCGISRDEVNLLGLSPHIVRNWSWKNAIGFIPWLVATVLVSLLLASLVSGSDKMKMVKYKTGVIASEKVFFDLPGKSCQWVGTHYETIDGEKIAIVADGKQFTVEVNLVPFITDALVGERWAKQQVLAVVSGQVAQVLVGKADDEYGRLHAERELNGSAVGPKGTYKLTRIRIYRR